MAGEKAKENKRLTASCASCGKDLSVELLTGVMVGKARKRRLVPVCQPCLEKGWTPERAEGASAPGPEAPPE